DRYVHYAWAATAEALADAGIANPIEDEELAERTGALIGSGIGGINTMIRDIIEAHELGVERVGPFLVTAMIADMAPGYVAIYANARGPNYSTVSACASSNHASGDALNIIRRGDADVMIAEGAEAGIGEIPVAAFSAMKALSTRRNDEPEKASRPFDGDRGHQDRLRRARACHSDLLDQVDDRAHARRRRRCRGDRLRSRARGGDRAAYHQLRAPGPGLRPGLRAQRRTRGGDPHGDEQRVRVRRPQRHHHPAPLG